MFNNDNSDKNNALKIEQISITNSKWKKFLELKTDSELNFEIQPWK